MRRLLWKEWQERRLWIALWVLAGVVTVMLGKGQVICEITGRFSWGSGWDLAVPLMALLAGLSGYGSELHGTRATFLYSRAITWKQLLAAKLLLGLIAVIVSVVISAITGCLLLPAEYHPFITLHSLVMGALPVVGTTTAAYLFGLSCSTVLSGPAGGVLVMVGLGTIADFFVVIGDKGLLFRPVLLMLSPLLAGLILVRFGVTLHSMARLQRFGIIVLVLGCLGTVLDYTPTAAYLYKKFNAMCVSEPEYFCNVKLTPDAGYAYVDRMIHYKTVPYLVRLRDGQSHAFPEWESAIDNRWLGNSILLHTSGGYTTAGNQYDIDLSLWQWHDGRQRLCRIHNAGNMSIRYCALSPDSRRVLIGGYDELRLCDMSTGQTLTLAKVDKVKLRLLSRREPGKIHGLQKCWWQTNDVVGYHDPFTKQRVLLSYHELSACSPVLAESVIINIIGIPHPHTAGILQEVITCVLYSWRYPFPLPSLRWHTAYHHHRHCARSGWQAGDRREGDGVFLPLD